MATALGTGSERRRALVVRALALAAALFVLLAPAWSVSAFPSQDGPAHVYNARLLLQLLLHRAPAAAEFYELHLAPFPNWFSHAALAALLTVFAPAWAERLLLTAYAVALPLAFGYAIRALRRDAAGLLWVSLPLLYGKGLHEGFYNRSFALVPFLLALGYYVRRRGRLAARECVALALISAWTYFTTATSAVVLALYLGVLGVAFALEDRGQEEPSAPWRSRLPGALALVPTLALLAWFQLDQAPQTTGRGPGLAERALYLGNLYDHVAYDRIEAWIAGAFAVALAAALASALRARVANARASWRDALLAVTLLLLVLYCVAPQVTIPGVRSEPQHFRLSPHVVLAALLWVLAVVSRRAARGLTVAAVAAAVALTAFRLPVYASLAARVDEQMSLGAEIPRGAVFLPISFDYEGGVVQRRIPEDWIIGPLWHAGARVAAERELVLVDNYEATTRHFPLRYRAAANPAQLLAGNGESPGCLRLGRFNRLAPRPVDSILVFRRALAPTDDCTRLTLDYLARHYRLVSTSPDRQTELFRLRRQDGEDGD
jgi:hypothetical protein